MTRTERPRVLVVGQPFNRLSGGGITLSNVFEGWPKNRLAAVSVPGQPVAFDVCERCYLLGREEITWVRPLSLVARSETPHSDSDGLATVGFPPPDTAEPRLRRQAKTLFRGAVDTLGIGDVLRSMHLSDPLREWIEAFEPDLVYSQLSDLPVMTLVSEILDETGSPFALHMMDDWPSSMYRRGLLAPAVRARAERMLGSMLRHACTRMAIGDAMAEAYLRRYSTEFVPIQNAVDMTRQDALASLHRDSYRRPATSSLDIAYTGRVGRANARSIQDVAQVVADMGADGLPIRLLIYTGSTDHPVVAAMSGLDGVEVVPAIPYTHVPAALQAADVLLMPLDFDDSSIRFAGLSMPTKIPEYMAAGRPVLTYAPRGSAAAAYAKQGGWSYLVDEPDRALLRLALTTLLEDNGLREAMGVHARTLASERHDARVVRSLFADTLTRAAREARDL